MALPWDGTALLKTLAPRRLAVLKGRMFSRIIFAFIVGNSLFAQEPKQPPKFRVAQPGEKVAVVGNISYATNRNAIAVGQQTKETATGFLDTPTQELKYGQANFKFDGRVHELGKLDQTIELSRRSRSNENVTFEPQKEAVTVYVHGYNNGFDDAVRQGVLLRHDLALKQDLNVFSWASKGVWVAYSLDRMEIKNNAPPLADYISKLAASRPRSSVSFIVHSMGNDVFLNAITLLHERGKLKDIQFGPVILAAPDVAADFFEPAVTKLIEHSDKVVHYFSKEDRPIFFSRFANFTHGVRAGAKVVPVRGLESIDVDQVNDPKVRMGHGYFAAVPEILNDVAQVLGEGGAKLSAADRQGDKVEELQSKAGFSYYRFK